MTVTHIYSLLTTNRTKIGNKSSWNVSVDNLDFKPFMNTRIVTASSRIGNAFAGSNNILILKCHNRAESLYSSDHVNAIVVGYLQTNNNADYLMFRNSLDFKMKSNPREWVFSLWTIANIQVVSAQVTELNIGIECVYLDDEKQRDEIENLK